MSHEQYKIPTIPTNEISNINRSIEISSRESEPYNWKTKETFTIDGDQLMDIVKRRTGSGHPYDPGYKAWEVDRYIYKKTNGEIYTTNVKLH